MAKPGTVVKSVVVGSSLSDDQKGQAMDNNSELKGVFKHPFIDDILELSKIERLTIRHADFVTGNVIIAVEGQQDSFNGILDSVRFVDMHDKMAIQSVDFETGEITVRWHPDGVEKLYFNMNVSKEEVEELKRGRKIDAIKACRRRTGMGLADAKSLIESAQDELRKRGVLK